MLVRLLALLTVFVSTCAWSAGEQMFFRRIGSGNFEAVVAGTYVDTGCSTVPPFAAPDSIQITGNQIAIHSPAVVLPTICVPSVPGTYPYLVVAALGNLTLPEYDVVWTQDGGPVVTGRLALAALSVQSVPVLSPALLAMVSAVMLTVGGLALRKRC